MSIRYASSFGLAPFLLSACLSGYKSTENSTPPEAVVYPSPSPEASPTPEPSPGTTPKASPSSTLPPSITADPEFGIPVADSKGVYPTAAFDGASGFIAAWAGLDPDGSWGVFAREFDSKPQAVGGDFSLARLTKDTQTNPHLHRFGNGDTATVWVDEGNSPTGLKAIMGRLWSKGGVAATDQFLVPSVDDGMARFPAIAGNSRGDFVVAWSGGPTDGDQGGGWYRRFDYKAKPLGPQQLYNSSIKGAIWGVAVGMNEAGDFAMAWRDITIDQIRIRMFKSNGQPVDDKDIIVSPAQAGGTAFSPEILVLPDNKVLVVWQERGSGGGCFGRIIDSSQKPGAFSKVQAGGNEFAPQMGQLPDGKFVFAWRDQGDEIHASVFSNSLQPLIEDFKVSSKKVGAQFTPDLAVAPDGRFLIVWQERGRNPPVQGRLFKLIP